MTGVHPEPTCVFRAATLGDVAGLTELIASSARELCNGDYHPAQIEAALQGAWGVDTQLIRDGTYFVGQRGGHLAICGGWSRFTTEFGGDAFAGRRTGTLQPGVDPAKIRAFFVHPDHARFGLASQLLTLCEAQALAAGFTHAELVATIAGARFYASRGYRTLERRSYDLPGGLSIDFITMRRALVASP